MPLLARIILSAAVVGGVGYGIWNHNAKETMKKEQSAAVETKAVLTTGNSNDDLDRDMATMDAQLKLIEQDSAAVDAENSQQKSVQ